MNIRVALRAFQSNNTRSVVGATFVTNEVASPFLIRTGVYSFATAVDATGLEIFRQYQAQLDGTPRIHAPRIQDVVAGHEPGPSDEACRYGCSQFSTVAPSTRPNSAVLRVTMVRPRATAIDAMSRSLGPIGVPFISRSARTRP